MIGRKKIAMQVAADELATFVRKEIAFQKADRDERAMKLRLPISLGNRETGDRRARE